MIKASGKQLRYPMEYILKGLSALERADLQKGCKNINH